MVTELGSHLRRPVAVLLSRFPTVTETFILREVIEMERQGQPVRLVPLLRDDPEVVHQETVPWMDRTLFTPFLSFGIITANLSALRRKPFRYVGMLLRMLGASIRHPRFLLGTLAYFPKSVYLATKLSEEGVRHVHAHFASHPASAALIISSFSDISFSITIHAHDLFVSRYTPFLGLKLRSAEFIRVISEYNRGFLLDRYPEVDPDRVHVVRVGVPLKDFGHKPSMELTSQDTVAPLSGSVPPLADAIGPVDDSKPGKVDRPPDLQILSVAGLRPYKGLPVLIEACRILSEQEVSFLCRIIGEGPMREELEQQISHAGLQDSVRLMGAMPQREVALHLKRRPIFVLPSVILSDKMMDGIPVALMEAMASGAPVVTSRISGIPELVEDGVSGVLLEPGDSVELASAILRLALDPWLAESLGSEGARKVAKDFSLGRCVGELLQLLDDVNPPHVGLIPAIPLASDPAVERHGTSKPQLTPPSAGARLIHQGFDSQVVEVLLAGAEEPIRKVVKTHADRHGQSRPPAQRARHEYMVMERLSSSWATDDSWSPVPRPVALCAEVGSVIMEPSAGRRLDDLLRSARGGDSSSMTAAEEAMEETGRWLSRFQEVLGPMTEKKRVVEAWHTEMATSLEQAGTLLHQRVQIQALETLGRAQAGTASEKLRVTGHHGDFWPGNVLVSPGGVHVVDFEGVRPGMALEDPAYFLLHAGFSFGLPHWKKRFKPLQSAFWGGYGFGDLSRTWEYHLSRISVCLRLLAMRATDPGQGPRLAHRLRIRGIRQALREAMTWTAA